MEVPIANQVLNWHASEPALHKTFQKKLLVWLEFQVQEFWLLFRDDSRPTKDSS